MGYRKCCVSGCKSTSDTHCLYRFPRDSDLRKLWMHHLVPQNSLLMLSDYQLLSRTVCQLHFERRMFDAHGKKLHRAFLCLFSEHEISCGVPLATGSGIDEEHKYCERSDNQLEDVQQQPSESLFVLRSKVKYKDGGSLSPTMSTTADAVEFFDKLFDSVNGRPGDVPKGKLRTAVKKTTSHLSFWQEAKK